MTTPISANTVAALNEIQSKRGEGEFLQAYNLGVGLLENSQDAPKNQVRFWMGDCQLEMGSWEKAEEICHQILEDPQLNLFDGQNIETLKARI